MVRRSSDPWGLIRCSLARRGGGAPSSLGVLDLAPRLGRASHLVLIWGLFGGRLVDGENIGRGRVGAARRVLAGRRHLNHPTFF